MFTADLMYISLFFLKDRLFEDGIQALLVFKINSEKKIILYFLEIKFKQS